MPARVSHKIFNLSKNDIHYAKNTEKQSNCDYLFTLRFQVHQNRVKYILILKSDQTGLLFYFIMIQYIVSPVYLVITKYIVHLYNNAKCLVSVVHAWLFPTCCLFNNNIYERLATHLYLIYSRNLYLGCLYARWWQIVYKPNEIMRESGHVLFSVFFLKKVK